MSAAKVSFDFELKILRCITCGIPFGLPDYFQENLRESHARFYCPNGHAACYPQKTEAEKLREELDATTKRLEFARNENRTLTAALGEARTKAERLRKRTANGACPCCKRSFVNLHRHMKTKHPDYAAEAE